MRSAAFLSLLAVLLIGSSCGTEDTSPGTSATSSGGSETGAQATSASDSTTGLVSSTMAAEDTSSTVGSSGSPPDVPLPSGPDGVVCGEQTCLPGDACNICNEDGSTSCVPPTGGAVCIDGWTMRCDGPEDCEAGEHCVFYETQLGNMLSCAEEDSFVVCDATPQIACHDDQDCPSGCQYCVPSDDPTAGLSFCRVMP